MMTTRTYFLDGRIIAESGDIQVYELDGVLYLNQGPGFSLWIDSNEIKELEEQLGNLPRGDCLELGLGLGVASQYILNRTNVNTLTTVEVSKDVIKVYEQLNEVPDNHTLIYFDGYEYLIHTEDTFDFIFIDFYSLIDEDTLPEIAACVAAAKSILRPEGEIVGWFDPYTPEEFVKPFLGLFQKIDYGMEK